MFEHTLPIRVYYGETDALGVVHHGSFVRYFEQARTEALREKGFELPSMLTEHGVQFAVVRMNIEYRKPARVDDQLLIHTKIVEVGRATVRYEQSIFLTESGGPLICKADIQLVGIGENIQPKALPKALRVEMTK